MNEVLWWSRCWRMLSTVDGSYLTWTEIVFRRRKLHCGPWTEVVSHAFSSSDISVRTSGSLEHNQRYQSGQYQMQTADCRPGTKCRLGSKCRLQTGYKMQTENLYCFFVWYVITFHLTTNRASRNAFPRPFFHYYLHYCGIFLACFFITIVLNIISSFHAVFSLCARVGWCDVCTEFTKLIKLVADVNWIFIT